MRRRKVYKLHVLESALPKEEPQERHSSPVEAFLNRKIRKKAAKIASEYVSFPATLTSATAVEGRRSSRLPENEASKSNLPPARGSISYRKALRTRFGSAMRRLNSL